MEEMSPPILDSYCNKFTIAKNRIYIKIIYISQEDNYYEIKKSFFSYYFNHINAIC